MEKAMTLTVCTQNVKHYFSKMKADSFKVENFELINMCKIEGLDLCGLQEMTGPRHRNLVQQLAQNQLHIKGRGRYFGIPCIDEYNSLIVNHDKFKVVSSKTYSLPWIHDVKNQMKSGAFMPRIAHVVTLETKICGRICIVVTHLDYQSPKVQKLQLDKLTKILATISEPTILMGDFNMFPTNDLFKIYKKEWQEHFGLMLTTVTGQKTWMGSGNNFPKENKPYDYIFATKEFDAIYSEVIDYREELNTDHKGVKTSFVLTKKK